MSQTEGKTKRIELLYFCVWRYRRTKITIPLLLLVFVYRQNRALPKPNKKLQHNPGAAVKRRSSMRKRLTITKNRWNTTRRAENNNSNNTSETGTAFRTQQLSVFDPGSRCNSAPQYRRRILVDGFIRCHEFDFGWLATDRCMDKNPFYNIHSQECNHSLVAA